MNAIAGVFPVFFFLVAALVCLTTMTRMVDEQRIYIGTYKALGYSKSTIASKYLLYAAFASISGSIFGFTLGFKIFPTVIFNAYRIMYTLPDVVTAFNTFYAVASTAAAVIVTTLAAWFACYNELKAEPATLMRLKAPKSGKRILMERIKFLWSRFNFIQKITARNLFRYKKRFFMTVIGIGGCTALLLTGFGLKDSIMSIVTKQFEELYQYDMTMSIKENLSIDKALELNKFISKEGRISDYMLIKQQNIDVGSDKKEKSVSLIVPESTEEMEKFITFRERTTGINVPFEKDGVILTEKLSKQLQVGVGDDIYIKDGDGKRINIKVRGITENYISHYVYMPPSLYESLYNEKLEYQQILAKTTDTTKEFENKLSTDMLKNSSIRSVGFTTGISNDFEDIIGSLNYVVLVLIFSAGALAFVVLYNLTNINVMERIREIATIKLLGFYDNEVSAYVYRENIFLTLFGIIFGLVLGVLLHKFIIVTAEVDYIMFGREIKPMSYIYSSILTMFFSGLVNFVMYFRLKKISMVESLKSVD
jgi:putative ABC transport system permease protein